MSISDWIEIEKFKPPDPKKDLLYFSENPQLCLDNQFLSLYDKVVELKVNQLEGLLNVDTIGNRESPIPRILILFEEISFQITTYGVEKVLEFFTCEFHFLEYKDVVANRMFSYGIEKLLEIADPFSDYDEFDCCLAHKICRAIYQLGKSDIGQRFLLPKPSIGCYISKDFGEGVTLYLIQNTIEELSVSNKTVEEVHVTNKTVEEVSVSNKFFYTVALEVPVDDELNIDAAPVDYPNVCKKLEITLEVIIEQSGVKEVEVVSLPENDVEITVKLIHTLFSQYFPLWEEKLQESIIFTAADIPITDDIISTTKLQKETCFYCKISDDTLININTTNNPPSTTTSTTTDSATVTESQPQRQVASRIFKRIVEVLVDDEPKNTFDTNTSLAKLQAKFQRIHFMILVPKYNTLRQQTKERIEKYQQLIRQDENSADFVYLYGNTGAVQSALKKWKSEILTHDRELYVLIVDECHYAPTKEAIPILHDDEVTSRNNFVALLVSATPYNCLSDQSRILAGNLIRWDVQDEVNPAQGCDNSSTITIPCYAGFEYYFQSLAFFLHRQSLAFKLTYTTSTTIFGQHRESKTVIIRLSPNRKYASFAAVAKDITKAIKKETTGKLLLDCEYDAKTTNASGFSFSLKDRRATALVEEIDKDNKLLEKLGFDVPLPRLDSSNTLIPARNNITIDDSSNVESQHLRQDPGLDVMCKEILKHCPELKRIITVKNRIGRLERHWDGLEGVIPGYSSGSSSSSSSSSSSHHPMKAFPAGRTMMAPKTGFTIILDYILSMAYFGSCRVDRQPINSEHVTLKPLLPTDNTNAISSEMNVILFLQMLEQCCYFEATSGAKECCNLGKALEVILELIVSEILEEKQVDDCDKCQLLGIYLLEKFKAEATASETSESESWFTETDRIVKMLLVDRNPAPMVLLRVYDNDENRSMQTILRHAMEVCRLTFTPPPHPSASPSSSSSSNGSVTDSQRVPGFSVIGDISDTKLLNILEPYYRDEYKISGEYGTDYTVSKIPQFRLQARNQMLNNDNFLNSPFHDTTAIVTSTATATNTNTSIPNKSSIKFSSDLKYEDLANIPCLIILCEKGRMGDTFPHNLRVLDLRLRTGGTASCFLQEIGRMCRYPKTKSASENGGNNGYMIVDKTTGSLLGFSTGSYSRQDLAASATSLPLSHPLPYALIQPAVRKSLEDAIDKREDNLGANGSDGNRDQDKIINYLTMAEGVDYYLSTSKNSKTINWSFESKLKKSNAHYDLAIKSKHTHRFLLAAECQIGKTGAYLHFLHLLRCAIESPVHGSREAPAPVPPRLPRDIPWIYWTLPYWKSLLAQPRIDYRFPKYGKYHLKIARQRLDMFFEAMKETSGSAIASTGERLSVKDKYISLIEEYEHTISEKGQNLLHLLPDYYNAINGDNNTSDTDMYYHQSVMRQYVNWDGRLSAAADSFTGARDFVGDVVAQWQEYQREFQRRGRTYSAATACFGTYNSSAGVDSSKEYGRGGEALRSANTSMPTVLPVVLRTEEYKPVAKAPLVASPGITSDPILYKSLKDRFIEYIPEGATDFGLHVPVEAFSGDSITQSKLNDIDIGKFPELLKNWVGPRLEYWIFTPTFAGEGSAGPEEKLLLRDRAMVLSDGTTLTRWMDYVEVLVLRAAQLEMYKAYYGSTHILATLPETLYKYADSKETVEVAQGGCGFARRYCQVLAAALGLGAIWMVDDNVQLCWQICNTGSAVTRGSATAQPASFADLMTQIEQIFNISNNNNNKSDHNSLGEFEKIPPNFKSKFRNMIPPATPIPQKPTTWSEVTGDFSAYGIIGTCRGRQWRKNITHPIKISHSVYSFFLLNVTATVKDREVPLLFPCRPIWEDIEFNNMLDEAGLVVCKMQRFAHCKPVRSQLELEETLQAVSESVEEKMCRWLEMEFPPLNDVILEKLELGTYSYEWLEMKRLYEELISSESKSDSDNRRVITVITSGIPPTFTSGVFKDQPRKFRLNDLVHQVCEESSCQPRCWVMIFPNKAHHILASYTTLLNDEPSTSDFQCSLKVYELSEELSEFYLVVEFMRTEKLREEVTSSMNPVNNVLDTADRDTNEVTEIDEIPYNVAAATPTITTTATTTSTSSTSTTTTSNSTTTTPLRASKRGRRQQEEVEIDSSEASTRGADPTSRGRLSDDIFESPKMRSRRQALGLDSDAADGRTEMPPSMTSMYSMEEDPTFAPTINTILSSNSCWNMDQHQLQEQQELQQIWDECKLLNKNYFQKKMHRREEQKKDEPSMDISPCLKPPSSSILFPVCSDTMMSAESSSLASNQPLAMKYDVVMDLTELADDRDNNITDILNSGSNPEADIAISDLSTCSAAYSDYSYDRLSTKGSATAAARNSLRNHDVVMDLTELADDRDNNITDIINSGSNSTAEIAISDLSTCSSDAYSDYSLIDVSRISLRYNINAENNPILTTIPLPLPPAITSVDSIYSDLRNYFKETSQCNNEAEAAADPRNTNNRFTKEQNEILLEDFQRYRARLHDSINPYQIKNERPQELVILAERLSGLNGGREVTVKSIKTKQDKFFKDYPI